MAWNNPDEFVVAGSGQVHTADVGSSLPSGLSTPSVSDWFGLGYHTEDGVSTNYAVDIFRVNSWQSKYETKRARNTESFRITFALQQFNEETVPLAFGGGEITENGGVYTFTPAGADAALNERAVICDVVDGDNTLRWVIPRASVVEGVEAQFTRTSEAVLPITLEALQPDDGSAPWFLRTNIAGFAAGS